MKLGPSLVAVSKPHRIPFPGARNGSAAASTTFSLTEAATNPPPRLNEATEDPPTFQNPGRGGAAAMLAIVDHAPILRSGEKDVGVAALLVRTPAELDQAELGAEEVERRIEIAHAQHGV